MTSAARRCGLSIAGIALALACAPARADGASVAARAERAAETLSAFARVEPIALLRLKALSPGVVARLNVRPGDRVVEGERLGSLEGPEIEALLAQRRGSETAAQAALAAARKSLDAARQNESAHLATRAAVARREASVVRAQADLTAARARLAAARAALELRAPVAGTVLALAVADGEHVARGQTVLTLQPASGLWLKAAFYGRAASELRVGMRGSFTPADGGSEIAVRVRSVFGALRPDGAREAGLVSTGKPAAWLNGEAGSVSLEGPAKTYAAVPTRALILDRGRWWVLVRGPRRDERRRVKPGPSRGDWTLIEHGIEPGAQVVVENAYLEFHRGVARRYQPPD